MSRVVHIEDSTLVALSRRPEGDCPARFAAHVARCRRCRDTLRAFRVLRERLRAGQAEPSAGAQARAWAIMEPRPAKPSSQDRFVLARLISDSGAAARVGVVRAPDSSRQRVWRIRGADVAVRLEPRGLGSSGFLHGQILPRRRLSLPVLGGQVWLYRGNKLAQTGLLGVSGDFELAAPESERWTLWLEWGDFRARLEWA